MEFSEACCEVDFILTNLNPEDKKKIPEKVINFFKDNKDLLYSVDLTTTKPLSEQNLKDETKAFLQIINYKYFANKAQKEEFEQIFEDVPNIENDYNYINKNNFISVSEVIVDNEEDITTELTVYKENKIVSFLKKILYYFKK